MPGKIWLVAAGVWMGLGPWLSGGVSLGQEPRSSRGQAAPQGEGQEPPGEEGAAKGLKRLHPEYEIWLDTARKRVVVNGEVCLREGPLELFACRKGTKEHEAIVAIACQAMMLHAALVAVGAEPGSPAMFQPEFQPARGTPIEIAVWWTDGEGKRQQALARDWVRRAGSQKSLESDWVFAGSGFWENPETGERRYLAEDGDLICVSNFPSATLDLPIESSQAAAELLFDAYTERIPPLGTKVTLVLTPRPGAAVGKASARGNAEAHGQ